MSTQETLADKKIKEFRVELDGLKDRLREKTKLQSDTYKQCLEIEQKIVKNVQRLRQ